MGVVFTSPVGVVFTSPVGVVSTSPVVISVSTFEEKETAEIVCNPMSPVPQNSLMDLTPYFTCSMPITTPAVTLLAACFPVSLMLVR